MPDSPGTAGVPACPQPTKGLIRRRAGEDACGPSTEYVEIIGFIALDFVSSKVET